MLELILGYFGARHLMANILYGVYSVQEAVYDLLVVLIFLSIALMFLNETRRFAIPALLVIVVVYVGLSSVLNHAGVVCTITGVAAAVALFVIIKPRIIRWARAQQNMNPILRWVLYLV